MSADRLQQAEDSLRHRYDGYVGVFDSGVGGISVLKELVKEVPDENYLFFGIPFTLLTEKRRPVKSGN